MRRSRPPNSSAFSLRTLCREPVFSVGRQPYFWEDVVLAGLVWGQWAILEQDLRYGLACLARARAEDVLPSREALAAAASAFRYERDLISADEASGWLARQALLLALGRIRDAAHYESVVTATLHAQFAIRAELFQAHAELTLGGGSRELGRALLHSAVARLDSTDLSPPATARLAELAASVAAPADDRGALTSLRAIVATRDAGRNLRSHGLARLTLDAADAFVRHDYETSIRLLERTRAQRFYGRSACALALLEADALRLAGRRLQADSLYALVSTPGELPDDADVWLSLRPIAIASISSPVASRMAALR